MTKHPIDTVHSSYKYPKNKKSNLHKTYKNLSFEV